MIAARLALGALTLALLAGCSLLRDAPGESRVPVTVPAPPAGVPPPGEASPDPRLERVAGLAESLLGAPYRFGGASPQGFDCSGLVLYVHGMAGITVPRTAAGQMLAARPVARSGLRRGDLLFFASAGPRAAIDHVGIYVGAGQFVHAPRSGRPVSRERLDERWYAERLVSIGRFQ